MQHGLCSITNLNDKQIDFRFNDHLRFEGQPHAICLSIGHPNDKMFASYRWKSPEQGWAVLVIDRCALWSLDTAFCNHNAADHRIRQRPLGDLKTLAAFDSLFYAAEYPAISRGQQIAALRPYGCTSRGFNLRHVTTRAYQRCGFQ